MQATLLGLSVAIILALVAALVGPHFVDWTQYRATFEAEASKLAGQPVRIAGPIDVRILPVPTLTLGRVEIGPRVAAARAGTRIPCRAGARIAGARRIPRVRVAHDRA